MYSTLPPRLLLASPPNLLAQRHSLDLFAKRPPVVRLELRILDTLLAPVLMQLAGVILRVLEVEQLVADALLDEDAAGVLLHDRLLVLHTKAILAILFFTLRALLGKLRLIEFEGFGTHPYDRLLYLLRLA